MKSALVKVLAILLAALLPVCGASCEGQDGDLYICRLLDNGSVMITGYRGTETDLVFPETIDGRTVTGLSGSFCMNSPAVSDLRSVAIPDTLTVVEPGAFQFARHLAEIRLSESHPVLSFSDGVLYNREKQSILLYLQCNTAGHFDVPDGVHEFEDKAFFRSKLVSLTLPASMERIGRECFDQCIFLKEITLSDGLKSIGTEAFANCDRLQQLVIPAGVTDIEEAAFMDNKLQAFRVDPANPVFTVSDGALVNVRDGVLIAWPVKAGAETCTVPDTVKRIGRFAFYRAHGLTGVLLPDSLLEIGRGAFSSCNHLTAVDLPDSVILLEGGAFEGNSDAESLHIPAGLAEITDNFNGMGITSLEIPETVQSIQGSFRSLPNLTKVTVPAGVRILGGNSFAFCKNLASVTLPAGIDRSGCSFMGCADTLAISEEP